MKNSQNNSVSVLGIKNAVKNKLFTALFAENKKELNTELVR